MGYAYVGDYKVLTMHHEHPLATSGGCLLEHRKVLYEKIGPGPHPCYWLNRYGCDNSQLAWGGLSGIVVDHLDDDGLNNDPDNLVPSCRGCNTRRGSKALLGIEDLEAIRNLHQAGELTLKTIGKIFGVSGTTASRIVQSSFWTV